jgi:hypothetical protein
VLHLGRKKETSTRSPSSGGDGSSKSGVSPTILKCLFFAEKMDKNGVLSSQITARYVFGQ